VAVGLFHAKILIATKKPAIKDEKNIGRNLELMNFIINLI